MTATGNASLTAVGVVYAATSANSNPQLSGTGVTALPGTAATGVFTVNATGLTAATAYSYAAYATNSQGTTYTSVGTFTTGPTPTLNFTTPSTASVAGGATLTNAVTSTLSGGSYGAISYTSSSPSVATVNATTGVVTGLSVGTTTITATQAAAAGFNAASSSSYTLTVTIDYTFTTLAGLAGAEGSADGTGSAARFKYPGGVAVDATGNVFVADESNHTIRKMTPSGVVTTLAGLAGSQGSTDGTGSAARFSNPSGVAVDAAGNIYVADRGNHTIRKITSGGMVTTLAGSTAGDPGSTDGTGTDARFYSPAGVAVDANGNVYVAERTNHTIRKITSFGVVTTLAGAAGSSGSTDGTGNSARFNQPRGVAVDAAGNVYVGDWLNHTIRKITSDAVVTTLAGTAGSSGSTNGTGSAARFNRPIGVAVDAAGNVYVGDQNNQTIRKITSAGVVTTLAGTAGSSGSTDGTGSNARFSGPAGVAVDTAGNLYVADQNNQTIRKGSLLPILTTPTSANLTTTTATLGGNVTTDGGSSITARGVVYAVTATNEAPQLGGTGVTNLATTGTTGVFTVNVTGLTAGTAYSYAAYATNSLGTGYTSVGTFTMGPTPTLTFSTPSTASVAVGSTLTNAVNSTLSGGSYGAITYISS
ncbi:MAG: NHL repeat-containing protein, partial [Opitutaceae bacterium]